MFSFCTIVSQDEVISLTVKCSLNAELDSKVILIHDFEQGNCMQYLLYKFIQADNRDCLRPGDVTIR